MHNINIDVKMFLTFQLMHDIMIDKLLLSLGDQFSSYEVAFEMLKILAFFKLNVKLIKIV